MNDGSRQKAGLPHNPELREVIAGKRKWATSLTTAEAQCGFKGWHERGYLPHRDEPGLTQMVTFHVVDSFPAELRSEWAGLLKIESKDERRRELQAYLDKGKGDCPLRKARIAKIVDEALRFHHDKHYELRAWVVMPNHLHVLFLTTIMPMGRVISKWKEYTGRMANEILGRRGTFWAKDYWDTYMRDEIHEMKARNYAENNPVKAGLVSKAVDWPWSSARFRDVHGKLIL